MPKGQPFTSLCQSLYKNASTRRVDLHTHSTFSDGICSPESVYSSACKLGLEAISITDHDTTAAHHSPFPHGRAEMIVGVEITCIFNAKVYHLLGYMMDPMNLELQAGLSRNKAIRKTRFLKMIDFMKGRVNEPGSVMDELKPQWNNPDYAVGSRHLAQILVNQKKAHSIQNAYWKHLRFFQDDNHAWLTIQEACDLVRNAGGISLLAHPPENTTLSDLVLLKGFGLDGLEVEYPGFKMNRRKLLKEWALKLEFCIGGGSDCHGVPPRTIGSSSITILELEKIKLRSEGNRLCSVLS